MSRHAIGRFALEKIHERRVRLQLRPFYLTTEKVMKRNACVWHTRPDFRKANATRMSRGTIALAHSVCLGLCGYLARHVLAGVVVDLVLVAPAAARVGGDVSKDTKTDPEPADAVDSAKPNRNPHERSPRKENPAQDRRYPSIEDAVEPLRLVEIPEDQAESRPQKDEHREETTHVGRSTFCVGDEIASI